MRDSHELRSALLVTIVGMLTVTTSELLLFGISRTVAEFRFRDRNNLVESACEAQLMSPPANARMVVLRHDWQSRFERYVLPLAPEEAIRICQTPGVRPSFEST